MNSSTEKYDFCTIFDSAYMTKGLALYYSLSKVCNFHLFIFTPDEKCIASIEAKYLQNVTIIHFKEIENKELLNVKSGRNTGEYYWTVKASCIKYLFSKFNLKIVSYIDADSFFYSSPKLIFDELGNKSVLIVPHNFSPKYKSEIKNGIYNAGFISFRNDIRGLNALNWWNDKCIEWCFNKKEDGKFGDQMYLNTLSKFEGVHTLLHKGALANWNVQQYQIEMENGSVFGITEKNEKFEVIFYHFHYLKFLDSFEVELGRKFLSQKVMDIFYNPYIKCLLEISPFKLQGVSAKKFSWKTPIIFLKRKLEGTYNILPVSAFTTTSD